jgi:hypothetical protein
MNPGFAGISFNPAKSDSGPVEFQVENNTIEQPLAPYDVSQYALITINPEGRGGGIHSFSGSNPSNVAIVKNNHMLNCGWGLLLVKPSSLSGRARSNCSKVSPVILLDSVPFPLTSNSYALCAIRL